MALGLVIQNFMRIIMGYMIKILLDQATRAAKDFENFNIFLMHSVLQAILRNFSSVLPPQGQEEIFIGPIFPCC